MTRKIILSVVYLLFFGVTSLAAQTHQMSSALDQYVEQASEFSSRARANVYFANQQSIFNGVQFSFVNAGTGNLTFLRRDMVASGRVPLVLARVYDSSEQGSREFGPGWRLSAAETILVADGRAHLFSENGSVIDFVQSSEAAFQLEKDYPSDYSTLLRTGGTIKTTMRSGLLKEFQMAGNSFRLVKVTDRNGNEIRLEYDRGGLSRIENANHFIAFTRNDKGRITLAQDDQNRKIQYLYDEKGRLIEVDDLGGHSWTYSYSENGKLSAAKDPLQRLNFGASYHDDGRVRRLQLPSGVVQFSYDPGSGLTAVKDRKGLVSRFFQNQDGITTRVVNALGEETAIVLDPSRNVVSLARNGSVVEGMQYDRQHRLASRHSTTDAGIIDRQYSYDSATGLLTGIKVSGGSDQGFAYDASGNLTSATLPDGVHYFGYSASGDLVSFNVKSTKLTFTQDSDGLFASMSDEKSAVTTMQYKTGGELEQASFPGVAKIKYDYQPSGLRAKTSYSNGRRVEYSYDPAGNLTATKVFDAKGKQINGQNLEMNDSYQLVLWALFDGTETTFQYDPNGNLTEIKKGKAATAFKYDELNRLTTVITPKGERLTYTYKPGERSLVEQYEHASALVADLRDSGFTFAGPLNALASRPLPAAFASVRFSETLGTYQLANADGSEVVRPQEKLESALMKLHLFAPDLTQKERQTGFNVPFNTMFMPAEYLTINCCPECFRPGTPSCPPCDGGDGGTSQPHITDISPSQAGAEDSPVEVTINLDPFNGGTTKVTLKPQSGTSGSITASSGSDSSGSMITALNLTSAGAGKYDLSVSDSGGVSDNSVTFTVLPSVDGIDPPKGLIGAGIPVTISGAGFVSGKTTVNAGPNITVSNVSVSSSTQIVATFTSTSSAAGNQTVKVTANGQTSNSINYFVQVPTSLSFLGGSVLPDGTAPPAGCLPSTPYGIFADLQYQVNDQSGAPIQSSSMTPHETGTLFTGESIDNNIGPVAGYPTSSATTASDGTFHDVPFGYCQNLPISNPGKTATQNITIIRPDGVSSPVRSQTWTVTAPGASSFEHGTLKNGSDITVSR